MQSLSLLKCAVILGFISGTVTQAQISGTAIPTAAQLIAQAEEKIKQDDNYEDAERLVSSALAQLQEAALLDVARKRLRLTALEIRAQALIGKPVADHAAAVADIRTLYQEDPNYQLSEWRTDFKAPGGLAKKAFEQVASEVLGAIRLTAQPASARVEVDGMVVPSEKWDGFRLYAGRKAEVVVSLIDHQAQTHVVTVEPGQTQPVVALLKRTASVLNVVSAPANASVFVNGEFRGKTPSGPPPDRYLRSDDVKKLDPAAGMASNILPVHGLPDGPMVLELKYDCFESVSETWTIAKPDEYFRAIGLVKPAKGTLAITGRGGEVRIDRTDVGTLPATMTVCEGEHVVEVRRTNGRFSKTVTVARDTTLPLVANARPAIAVMFWNMTDAVTKEVLSHLSAMNTAEIVPLTETQAEAIRKTYALQQGWLKTATPTDRRAAIARLTQEFNVQGVAEVAAPDGPRRRLELTLLAPGSVEPDVVPIPLEEPGTLLQSITKLDKPITFFESVVDVRFADVQDGKGAIQIVVIDSQVAGLAPGDEIVAVAGRPIADASAVLRHVSTRAGGERLAVAVRDGGAAARQVSLPVRLAPTVIGLFDQTHHLNKLLLDLRLAVEEADETSRNGAKLNLAVALMRANAWREALAELAQVEFPDGPGVSKGTVHYLRAYCHEKLNDRNQAEAEYQNARTSSPLATLTLHGTPIRELIDGRASRR